MESEVLMELSIGEATVMTNVSSLKSLTYYMYIYNSPQLLIIYITFHIINSIITKEYSHFVCDKHKLWPYTPLWGVSLLLSPFVFLLFLSQLLHDQPLFFKISKSHGLIHISGKSMEGGPSNLFLTKILVIIFIWSWGQLISLFYI